MAISKSSKIIASDMSSLINGLSISGKTITYTKVDGTTDTLTTQDTNTTYTAGTGISISSNKISNSGVTSINGSTGAVTINTSSNIPNYSARIDLGTTNNYVAPSDGVWYGSFTQTQANWANVYVNGVLFDGFGSWTTGYPTLHAFVSKGDTISWETGHSCQWTAFVPFK